MQLELNDLKSPFGTSIEPIKEMAAYFATLRSPFRAFMGKGLRDTVAVTTVTFSLYRRWSENR